MAVVKTRVWVDNWQMQCCGHPFEVGGEVVWPAIDVVDRDYLSVVLGETEAARVTHAQERHSNPKATMELRGRVRWIGAVFCRYAPGAGGPRNSLSPVAGTVVVEDRRSADGWEPESGGLRFVGYVADVDVAG